LGGAVCGDNLDSSAALFSPTPQHLGSDLDEHAICVTNRNDRAHNIEAHIIKLNGLRQSEDTLANRHATCELFKDLLKVLL
jgi:hypothetical protein